MDAGAWNLTTEKSVAIAIICKNLIWLQQSKLKTLFPGFVNPGILVLKYKIPQ